MRVKEPLKHIYQFEGRFEGRFTFGGDNSFQSIAHSGEVTTEPLSLENTIWANTVIASKNAYGIVIYTGKETRSVMNSSNPKNKFGVVDQELNKLAKLLFFVLIIVGWMLISLRGFEGEWGITFTKYLLLLTSIIPISLRVNLDISKAMYSF